MLAANYEALDARAARARAARHRARAARRGRAGPAGCRRSCRRARVGGAGAACGARAAQGGRAAAADPRQRPLAPSRAPSRPGVRRGRGARHAPRSSTPTRASCACADPAPISGGGQARPARAAERRAPLSQATASASVRSGASSRASARPAADWRSRSDAIARAAPQARPRPAAASPAGTAVAAPAATARPPRLSPSVQMTGTPALRRSSSRVRCARRCSIPSWARQSAQVACGEQPGQVARGGPREALDAVGETARGARGEHGVERVGSAACGMTAAEDAQAGVRVRRARRARRPRRPSRRRTTARDRRTRARAARRARRAPSDGAGAPIGASTTGGGVALGCDAAERREHPDDVRALRLVGDEQQVGAVERREHAAAERPRSADRRAGAARARRAPGA